MKNVNQRIKWLVVGIGVMYAMQSAVLLVLHYVAPAWAPEGFHNILATVGTMLAAFLVGGFVIGLMAERILLIEPTLAALGALLIDMLLTKTGVLKEIFLTSIAMEAGQYGTVASLAAIAIVAAIAGSLVGERMVTPQEQWISQAVVVVGLAGLLLGPFLVLSRYLPITFSVIVGLALLGGIALAAYRFEHPRHELEEVSINPDRYVDSKQASSH
ncbi:MAG: hypothetical protein RMM98_17040 [Acidobacteriota bacterium]|nr:hypothetical protein [Blastocatellia bacterium]MDW8241309.1 hypothetical protein [Acidobacteriota bacterium]